jgi:ribosomal protein S18 acetylase RimI-like enzyme
LIIRPAQTRDIPALCVLMQSVQALHAEAYPEVFRGVLDPEATARFFEDTLMQAGNIVLVAAIADSTVGYIWCEERVRAGSFYAQDSHGGHIHHVAVSSEYRRCGVGMALVDRALSALKERGASRVTVEFWDFNEGSRAFFKSAGFLPERTLCSKELSGP